MPPAGFCAPHALLGRSADAPLAVALSGGADSVALLHILSQTHKGPLYALHVHHGIRGAEADRDAAFCESFAASLDIPFTCLCVDVPARAARTGESMETAARIARYAALEAFLCEHEIPLLATAHHADDQLETVLQHLLRGTGLRGLCGIPEARPLGKATVVRPLLQLTKEQILAYCHAQNLDFVTDSTNGEPCCARNRLRLEVLPVLRELWPAGAASAARCARSLAEDEAYLQAQATAFLRSQGSDVSCDALAALPAPILARVLRVLLPLPPEAVHVEAIARLVRDPHPHASLSVPGATVFVKENRLCVSTEPPVTVNDYEIELTADKTPLPNGLAVWLQPGQEPPLQEGYRYAARIDLCADAVCGKLVLRPRRAGDRILALGHHRSVRKLPCMAPFSPDERARMPLLCDANGLLAIPFGPVRDGAKGHTLSLAVFFN